ncbi:WHG domain-containing protein [Paenibacillus sp. TRM 82003]|uniref:TetR/AcrR family transcriptional regulator n=1 Tax=Kineococcus sp. TRM81007 TaxID=2925831 RepID=UPI001F563887|nr:TetR-like C-terminal domain-containing protein [Kineococcus sp. TRM81007]MCI2239370.1 WHG domain-containing protein [Kineococcus sp. TRM81007]MCI3925052.1 WHG domain-containing protein [Paenibacillus sp. TRM 82003]
MPRAGLSRDAVVALAVDLVAGSWAGPAELSLAAVAARAGVTTPGLYKHVGSLADLRAEVALVAVRELTSACTVAAGGRAGEDGLRALAHAVRAFAAERPGLYAAAQVDAAGGGTPELAAAASELVGLFTGVLEDFALPRGLRVDAVRTVRAAVHGFVVLQAQGGFRLPDDPDRSVETLLDVLVAGLRSLGGRAVPGDR